ncbi:unnamed protein product [Schistosoma rodhaini]|nr:unnamed protein product [Schistosoma rodhaini]
MMQFLILFSRQGKLRLQKWYISYSEKEKKKILRDLTTIVLSRKPKMCSFIEWKDLKVVYRRHVHFCFIIDVFSYASLYFCAAVEPQDNELLTLEIIHRYVELLDKYFGSVSLTSGAFILFQYLFMKLHMQFIVLNDHPYFSRINKINHQDVSNDLSFVLV